MFDLQGLESRRLLSGYAQDHAFALGGDADDQAGGVVVDPAGNLIVWGRYSSSSLDADPGPGESILPNAGSYDSFVAKYDPAGALIWARRLASAESDGLADLSLDSAGNLIIAFSFSGPLSVDGPGSTPVTLSAGTSGEGHVAKLDPAGNLLWATKLTSGTTSRTPGGVAADSAGNVFATGLVGANSMFISKFTSGGAQVWSKTVSGGAEGYNVGGGYVRGADVLADASGNVIVTGQFRGTLDFNPDSAKASKLSSMGGNFYPDAFVLKLSAAGAFVWSGAMGGRGYDLGRQVALDSGGNAHVYGSYWADPENDFDPGSRKVPLSGSGAFVAKLSANRGFVWARGALPTGGMTVDPTGNVYLTGGFGGTYDADPGPGTFNLTAVGDRDVVVSQLNSSGNLAWAGRLGGPGYHSGYSVAVDGSGGLYVAGDFAGTLDCDPGTGEQFLSTDGGGDAFIVKLLAQ